MNITGGFAINTNIQLTSQAYQEQKVLIAGHSNDFNNEKHLSKDSSNILIHPNNSMQPSNYGIDELI